MNSLWSLSLVVSLSCALLATSLHQWARRYLRMAQPARRRPEERARMRAFFSNGVEKMHVPWAVEGLPTLIHLSLFLFFGGLVIFLFNIDHDVFISVVWWIVLFSLLYGFITLLPIIRHDSPYNSPLSTPAWFLYTSIHHVTFKILAFITPGSLQSFEAWCRCEDLKKRYQGWRSRGVEKVAKETASKPSSEIDVQILDWTVSASVDDDPLKGFFEAIPGFFDSKLVNYPERDFPEEFIKKFRDALVDFLGRTWSSNSANDSEKVRRFGIAMSAMSSIRHSSVSSILRNILFNHWDEVPQTIEMGQTLAHWCNDSDQYVAQDARLIIARILLSVQERNDSWVTLTARVFGPPKHDFPNNINYSIDSALLSILIKVIRPAIHTGGSDLRFLGTLPKLDILKAHPRLQHDFCGLWNKIVREARARGSYNIPTTILSWIRPLYISLHQGTDAAPTAFSASTDAFDPILSRSESYPFCRLDHHHPDSTPQISAPLVTPLGNPPNESSPSSTDGGNTASRQAE